MKYIPFSFIIFLTACINNQDDTAIVTQNLENISAVGYPYQKPDGNRVVDGHADITSTSPIDIELPGTAEWIATVADGDNSLWAAVLSNGDVKAFKINSSGYEAINVSPARINSSQPITLALTNNELKLANVFTDGSPYSSPVILNNNTGARVYIANNGDLVLDENENQKRLAIDALSYSRILLDDQQRLLVLTKPTLYYDHQVLGTAHKNAAEITIIETSPEFKVASTIPITQPDVIEGNPLIWVDVNGDGTREIVTTLSNVSEGARVLVFNEDGSIYAESTAIGIGYRWRHQIAIAPFQNDDQLDLVSIYIPHLGPQAEFFRLDDSSMTVTRTPINYSSHLNISLNLDKSLVGDFDNDNKPELLVINRDTQQELAGISYDGATVSVDWTLPLAGKVSSNIAAVELQSGKLALGIGQGNSLRVWQP